MTVALSTADQQAGAVVELELMTDQLALETSFQKLATSLVQQQQPSLHGFLPLVTSQESCTTTMPRCLRITMTDVQLVLAFQSLECLEP